MINNNIKLYVILCSIFTVMIVTGNLIFQKFVTITLFTHNFDVSVGVFIYPFAFLISDTVTEFYGKENAKFMVKTTISCSIIVGIFIYIANAIPATKWSLLDDKIFNSVFNVYGISSISSIIANYFGQLVDINVYYYLKKLSKNKNLWVRNNVSTIFGQFIDTITVIFILCIFGSISWGKLLSLSIDSLAIKILASILITPICYALFYSIRKLFFENTT